MVELPPVAPGEAVLTLLDPAGPRTVPPDTAVVRADDLGLLRGEAVFETVRVAGGRPAFLPEHLARLGRSAARLELPLPAGWPELVAHLLAEAPEPLRADGVLRLVCTRGAPGQPPLAFGLLTPVPAETVRAREQGVRAVTLTLGVAAGARAAAPWLLGGVKCTSYAVNMASLRHAAGEGCEDAIWLSSDGQVLEAPTSSVAWVTGGTLVTPPAAEVGVLAGTTVAAALDLLAGPELATPGEVRPGTAAELAAADEVLLLSSIRGVAPVVQLDGRPLPVGPVTAGLRAAFERATR